MSIESGIICTKHASHENHYYLYKKRIIYGQNPTTDYNATNQNYTYKANGLLRVHHRLNSYAK